MNQHNLELILQIRAAIEQYLTLKLPLNGLVSALEELMTHTEYCSIPGLFEHWAGLESTNAAINTFMRDHHTPEDNAVVCDSIIGIFRALDAYQEKSLHH